MSAPPKAPIKKAATEKPVKKAAPKPKKAKAAKPKKDPLPKVTKKTGVKAIDEEEEK